MSDLPSHVQVRFTRSWRHYVRGDLATFPIGDARNLVAQRVAEGIAGVGPAPPVGPAPASPPMRQGPTQRVEKTA